MKKQNLTKQELIKELKDKYNFNFLEKENYCVVYLTNQEPICIYYKTKKMFEFLLPVMYAEQLDLIMRICEVVSNA